MVQKNGRVLCVDDEPNILRSLTWLLQKDFEVRTATGAREALALVEEHDFDVIISDQRMPGMSGSDFLHEAGQISPRSMRIMLTGYSDLQGMVRSVNDSEVFRFINKPWKIDELPAVVAEAAAIARARDVEVPPLGGGGEAGGDGACNISTTILVIDDEATVIAHLYEGLGREVPTIHASSIAQAIAALAEHDIGIVLADTRVDHTDTTGLLRVLKQQEPQIVAVVYTTAADSAEVVNLINQGQVFRILTKPVKPGILAQAVTAAERKRRQLREHPYLALRHTVEAVSDATRASFAQAAEQSTTRATAATGKPDETLLQRIASGLRRLLGN